MFFTFLVNYVLFSFFMCLYSAQSHDNCVEQEAQLDQDLVPLRRAVCMDTSIAAARLMQGNISTKLITMVVCYPEYANEFCIRESKIIRLIKKYPHEANPYSGDYNAHLITLAARYGHVSIVKSIVECNPEAMHCFAVVNGIEKETPLDEAIIFRRKKVARFLYEKGASFKKMSQKDLIDLFIH